MRILVTGVGGPTPRSIGRALKQFGRFGPYELVGVDSNPHAIGLYCRELFDCAGLVPPASHPEYWSSIEALIRQHRIQLAVVQPEAEVEVWSARAESGELPCPCFLPALSLVQAAKSKSRMSELLEGTDLVPRTLAVDRAHCDPRGIAAELGLPYWIRSGGAGTSGLGAYKVKEPDELAHWMQLNCQVDSFIASTFLPGRNLAVKLLYWRGSLLRSATAERLSYIMAKVAPSGITGNVSMGRLLNAPDLVVRADGAVRRLAAAVEAPVHGFFTVDLKEDPHGLALVTEINVRHIATTGVFAAGGANLAEDVVRVTAFGPEVLGKPQPYTFDHEYLFLREVDQEPILIRDTEMLRFPQSDEGPDRGRWP